MLLVADPNSTGIVRKEELENWGGDWELLPQIFGSEGNVAIQCRLLGKTIPDDAGWIVLQKIKVARHIPYQCFSKQKWKERRKEQATAAVVVE